MIKNIARIALASITFVFLILSVWSFSVHFSLPIFFENMISSGLIIHKRQLPLLDSNQQNINLPYMYINLPINRDYPLALDFYLSQPIPDENGQDPDDKTDTDEIPQTTTPPDTESPDTSPPKNTDTPSTTDVPQPPTTPPTSFFPIISIDLSENQTVNNITYKNESKYTPNVNQLAKKDYPIKYAKTVDANDSFQPVVLIIHTHGTECYMPENQTTYTYDTVTRTNDKNNNVVAVGKVLADTLNSKGVPTLHCDVMFDEQSYSQSYNLSEKAIKEYLAQYPSIQYVFDVHRDSIIKTNNEKVKTLATVDGTPTAQAMFVVGTDSSGAEHPNWLDNLTVASVFQYSMIEKYGNIMRPINLRAASFNAEHTPGSILIEIGTCGNTLSEAKNCAALLGNNISDIILNDGL